MATKHRRQSGALGPPDLPVRPPRGKHDSPRADESKGARTRRKLLEAAEQILGTYGYHDASIVKITEAAGVSQGTFYLYFSSKKEVFDEVVADLNRKVRRAMTEAARDATTRLEAELMGFAGFFRFTAEHPSLYSIIRQAEFVSPAAMRNHYEKVSEGYTQLLRDAMATGEVAAGDPMILAWSLMAVGEMIGMRWIVWDEEKSVPDDVFDEMSNIIARMLGATSNGHSKGLAETGDDAN